MERREDKLKALRGKKDQFFREDPQSPLKEAARKNFNGLIYYPLDLKYAMVSSIERYPIEPKPLYVNLPTSKGQEKKYVKYGRFRFRWEGKEYVLQVYRPLGGGDLFLPFKDKTSGKETNRAHNPFCQYNEKYVCPFAPEENWLPIEIRAGEKRFR
jgi:uncharacterized protein (DUF1684 family)